MNIAILGATSHIAKGLIANFLNRSTDYLYLFSRNTDNISHFLKHYKLSKKGAYTLCSGYSGFHTQQYDLIINCVGVETRNKHNCDFTRYFSVTEEFDNLVINYLKNKNRCALYISFSSGAVYGKGFDTPAGDDTHNSIAVNHISQEDCYSIARLNAEAKHRAHSGLNIVDLRVFAYFSRYINLTDGYFITDIIQAIQKNEILITDNRPIIRDYLHPDDLYSIITKCAAAGRINGSFDVNSAKPVTKQEILDYFTTAYGLKYESRSFTENASATGAKSSYYSISKRASGIGYNPEYTSMDAIAAETKYLLQEQNANECRTCV